MPVSARQIVLLPVFLACTVILSAQRPTIPAPASKVPTSETGPTSPITIDVFANHKNDPPAAGLTQQDFTLLDNKASRPITAFKAVAGPSEPVEVILIIDAVNANYTTVASARQQISHFLKAEGGHLAQPTALAVFTDAGIRMQPAFTTDGNVLAASLDSEEIGLRTLRRSQGFYGADDRTQLSLRVVHQLIAAEGQRPGRKVVIWISPGWPLLSGPAIDLDRKQQQGLFRDVVELSTQLRRAHVTFYSADPLGTNESVGRTFYYQQFTKGKTKPSQTDLADLSLQVLSEQSGGRVLNGSNDIGDMLRTAYQDTSVYYELTFTPPPAEHPDEYHHIEVQLARPGLTLHAPDGYYNQP